MYIGKELVKVHLMPLKAGLEKSTGWQLMSAYLVLALIWAGVTLWTFSVLNSQLSSITACFNFLKVTWELVLLQVFDLDLICFYCAEALLIWLV